MQLGEITDQVLKFMARVLREHGHIVWTNKEFVLELLHPSMRNRDGWVSLRELEEIFARNEFPQNALLELLASMQREGLIEHCLVDRSGVSVLSYRRKLRADR